MALLERVTTLLRANLNDLIDKAEDPEKMIKQIILDMQNQLMQVKTQVAIAIADQRLLEKKLQENMEEITAWKRKAELAVNKDQDGLARAALERSLSHQQMADGFRQQVDDQKAQVENLKSALRKLEQKLAEAESRSQLLIAQHRRAKAVGKAADAGLKVNGATRGAGFDRMKQKVAHTEAVSQAKAEMAGEDALEDRFAQLEKEDEVEKLLQEIKQRRAAVT
ncbi:MAG: PspA/IM30 family protein [Acidobacteriales bacterium]|nr:PspA/IM30 family protein [Terriglobales bacterium]